MIKTLVGISVLAIGVAFSDQDITPPVKAHDNSALQELIRKVEEARLPKESDITETFIITEVTNEYIRGELLHENERTSEGIYYERGNLLEPDTVRPGFIVDITWTEDAYENGEWLEYKFINWHDK